MNKAQFLKRFHDATGQVISYTQVVCFNRLNPDHKFILSPNVSTSPVVLDDIEVAYIKSLNELQRRPISMNEAVELLFHDDRTPLWINMSVYEATDEVTLIELVCARRLRSEAELSHKVDKYPPFHVLAPIPPKNLKVEIDNKFDVNWRSNEARGRNKGLLNRVKSYFS